METDLVSWVLANYGQEIMRPGLSRMKEALKDLRPSFRHTKIVTIAGTNGKGETTLRLSGLLRERTHFAWTSPHIERLTERFRSADGEIDPGTLRDFVTSCHEEAQRRGLELSFYEFLFFVFCSWAAKNPPEFLLLEVGLGGRLDAVNVFDADLVLLPSISRDHQEILGPRYDLILREKLGTLRKKTHLIHFMKGRYVSELAHEEVRRVGASVTALEDLISLPSYEFSLRNQLLASAAFCHLSSASFDPLEWLQTPVALEHRGEIKTGESEWAFFGSHNVDGMRKLIQFLISGTYNFSRPPYDLIIVAFSRRDHRDLRVMMRMLKAAKLGKVLVTSFPHPKAEKSQTVESLSKEEGLDFVQDIESHVQGFPPGQRILVTGSYYFLGHFKSFLRRW